MTDKKNNNGTTAKELRHELRTPINQIIGYGEMLEEEAGEEGHDQYLGDLKKIGQAARTLLTAIDGLDFDALAGNGSNGDRGDSTASVKKAKTRDVPAAKVKSGEYVAPAGSEAQDEPDAPARVLVVDDVELNRSMLSRRLERRGFDVELAEGGNEALAMIAERTFDIVLLDIMMPEVSGYDVLEEVRKTKNPLELPIIMATAKDQGDDVVNAFKLGANDYITKPIDFPVALARIETQLSRKRATEQSKRLMVELERHNQFIRKTFGRYLSKDVVESLLASPDGLALGGEKRVITILMSDLRGFSALSEKLDPEQVVTMLNSYLGKMADIVTQHNGTIDEFIGDAILAIFGAPIQRDDDVDRAIACALQMQLAMDEVNEENKQNGFPELEMGIALNTGECVVGNIGSQKRAKYGIVGSHVNLTGRIESYTVGGQILISHGTSEAADTELILGDELKLGAKGFKEPVTVYDLLGMKGSYDLALPQRSEELRGLLREIPVEVSLLDGKHVKEGGIGAKFLALSMDEALISCDKELNKLDNVKLQCTGLNRVIIPGDLYAKVTDESDGKYTLRFTSVPDEIKSYLRSILANEVA